MSTAHFCHLRSGLEYKNAPIHDGRMGYWASRAKLEVSTANGDLSRLWRLRDYGPTDDRDPNASRKVTLEAVETGVPGMPENPDGFRYWSHQPLLLTAAPEGPVRLGGVGWGLAPEANSFWIAECQVRPDPDGGPRRILAMRLESVTNPEMFLGHARDLSRPDFPLAVPSSDLVLNRQVDAAGHDMWWYVEVVPAAARALNDAVAA